MLVDSHCHLNMIDLTEFGQDLDALLLEAKSMGVSHFLCVCVELADLPVLRGYAERYDDIKISVGVHPNTVEEHEPDSADLIRLANTKGCIAIGETGLDYYRVQDKEAQLLQQERFIHHIEASRQTQKPLIIHTREAASDTLSLMKSERADEVGGVMHCFAEDWEVAKRALDLNFYISFSGIVTFKNAKTLQEVAKKVPLDRMLIETDSPYLAPVPFRGKQNHPGYVYYVAKEIAALKGIPLEEVAHSTTENFKKCFYLSDFFQRKTDARSIDSISTARD